MAGQGGRTEFPLLILRKGNVMRRLHWFFWALWIIAGTETFAATTLRPVSADSFLISPEKPTTLSWIVSGDRPTGPLAYVLRDYTGRQVDSSKATVGSGRVEATVRLAAGYYELEFPAIQRSFGVVSIDPYGGQTDPFFAIDAAMSWLVRNAEIREGLVRALRRGGVPMARERLNWESVEPQQNQWQWDTAQQYETLRQAYRGQGVEILEMFHNTPAWTGTVGKYPDDLVATARSWRPITDRWRPTWGALEIWNEPDISFGDFLPADQYMAVVRAIAYGLKDSDVPLVGGVFAHYSRPFLDNAADNGLLDCVEAVSFHTYGRAEQMEKQVADYRAWLAAYGRGSMPLWITEGGRPWRRGPDRPPHEQDAASALDITMKGVEARACGIARYFPFVYPFYEERENNFGMMGREATPLRSMAAYLQLVSRLAHKKYLGTLASVEPAVPRARVFGDDRETLAVLYTGKPDGETKVKLGVPVLRVEGIDGRPIETDSQTVPIPDGLAYVWLDGRTGLQPASPSVPPTATLPVSRGNSISPILLRYQIDPAVVTAVTAGYRTVREAPAALPVKVRVFNLGHQPQELAIRLSFDRPAASIESPAEQTLSVPAESFADVVWQTDLSRAFAGSDRLQGSVTARGASAGNVLPLVIGWIGEGTLQQRLERFASTERLPIEQLDRWRPAIAGGGKAELKKMPEGHWRLEAKFAPGDRWVYPRFSLPNDFRAEAWEGLLVRARCERPATVRIFVWEGTSGVGYLTAGPIIPADGKWHTAVIRFADLSLSTANAPDPNQRLDLDQVRSISIGMNSNEVNNAMEVSHAHAIGGRK